MKKGIIGLKDLDRLILLKCYENENQEDNILQYRLINKYYDSLFTNSFFYTLLQTKYYKICNTQKEKWIYSDKNKEIFIEAIYYIRLLKQRYNFSYTNISEAHPLLYEYLLYYSCKNNKIDENNKQTVLYYCGQVGYQDLLFHLLKENKENYENLTNLLISLEGCIIGNQFITYIALLNLLEVHKYLDSYTILKESVNACIQHNNFKLFVYTYMLFILSEVDLWDCWIILLKIVLYNRQEMCNKLLSFSPMEKFIAVFGVDTLERDIDSISVLENRNVVNLIKSYF
jgi:hypothetical protein